MDTMHEWLGTVAQSLGVDDAVAVGELLDITRDVAHNIDRPAAPLTLHLIGLAVGAGMTEAKAIATVKAQIAEWQTPVPE